MTTYTPAPGTVAFRVIGWLEEQGSTKEFNASQIANALELDPKTITLPQHASPGVGPMGAGQPADAGPTCDDQRSGGGGARPAAAGCTGTDGSPLRGQSPGRHSQDAGAAPGPLHHHDERPREVDAQFARSIDKALADPEVRFALWDDDRLICVANGAVLLRCTPEQTHRLRQLLGGA